MTPFPALHTSANRDAEERCTDARKLVDDADALLAELDALLAEPTR